MILTVCLMARSANASAPQDDTMLLRGPLMLLQAPSNVDVGLTVRDQPAARRDAGGMVVVSAVSKGSSADIAGIRANDIIEAIDELAIASAKQLFVLLGDTAPGKAVTLTVRRGQSRFDVRLVPRARIR
jgi:S1-C subfamily serine protease